MHWSSRIRQTHRGLSIAFTVTVIANFVALSRGTPPAWVTYSPLLPLALLLFSGLYLLRAALRREVADQGNRARGITTGWSLTMATRPRSKSTLTSKPRPKAERASRAATDPASRLIDQRINELGGWRGETLARMRSLILAADPEITAEWKWSNPVWSRHGIVCTGEAYAKVVKLTFARGASVPDPSRVFNSSLQGNTRRALDICGGEKVNATAFKALVRAAAAANGQSPKKPNRRRARASRGDSSRVETRRS